MSPWVMAAAAVGALALAGCSSGPSVTNVSIGKSDRFCTDTMTFQNQAAALEAASTSSDLPTLRSAATTAYQGLVTLQNDAKTFPDKVGGHLVKDDLGVAVSTYAAVTAALNAASPTDPNAVTNALSSVESKEGASFTQATGRLDAYTKKVCGLTVSTPASTVAPSTTAGPTTTAVVGPVAPTTTAAPGSSTTAASSSVPASSTTSTSAP